MIDVSKWSLLELEESHWLIIGTVTLTCATVTKWVRYCQCTQNRLTFTITEIKSGSKIGCQSHLPEPTLIETKVVSIDLLKSYCVFVSHCLSHVWKTDHVLFLNCVCVCVCLFSAPCLSHGRWVATDDYVAVLGPSLPPTSTVVLKNMLSPGKTLSTEEEKKKGQKKSVQYNIYTQTFWHILRTFLICLHCGLCPG